jgi:hypothetical protein
MRLAVANAILFGGRWPGPARFCHTKCHEERENPEKGRARMETILSGGRGSAEGITWASPAPVANGLHLFGSSIQ